MLPNKKYILAIWLLTTPCTGFAADSPGSSSPPAPAEESRVVAPPTSDLPTTPLSLESTILFALDGNPGIKADVEKVRQAHFSVEEARADYYPQVSLTAKGGHEYNNPTATAPGATATGKNVSQSNSTYQSFLVSQILYNGFATDEEVYRQKDLEKSAGYTALVTIENTLQDAISFYIDVWRYQRDLQESEEFVASLEKIGKKIALMNEAGAESKAKKEYVDSRVAAAHTALNAVKASLTDALSNLQTLTGPLPPFSAQRPMQLDPTVRPIEAYYQLGSTDNNRLLLNASDHAAVEHQINEQDAAYLPTVNMQLSGDHGYDIGGHIGNTWHSSAMVVMNYKLFDGYQRDATEGRLKSQKAENEYRQAQLERDLRKDIRKSYNQILATKQDLTSNMKEILSSENLQDLYQKQFELGEGDIINMIEGYERLHTAKINSHKLEANMVEQSYTLLQKVGALRKERFCATC